MATAGSSNPIVVSVLAANGQQSSAIISHLLSLGSEFSRTFRLRAVVRDPSKYVSPATVVGKEVDEVVAGDMNDALSLDQALKDTHVVWAITNPNPASGIEAEIQQGKTIIDAFIRSVHGRAKSTSKPLLLLSTLIDVEKITKGEIKMINATSKGRIESYVHSLPCEQRDTFSITFVHPGMFMQNFLTYQKPSVDDRGIYHFTGSVRPDVQVPFVDITDLGPLVWHLLQTAYLSETASSSYATYDGASVRLYGQYLSYPELVEQFSRATGLPAVYDYMSIPKFLSLFFGGTEAEAKAQLDPQTRKTGKESMVTMIGDMYNLINRYGYYGTGALDSDEDEKDVRMQKIIDQQPTRRTRWTEFVEKNFGPSTASESSEPVLSLPANFPATSSLSKAARFLYEHISYFVQVSLSGPDSGADFEKDVLPKFHIDGVVEFPYLPKALREIMGVRPLSSNPADDGAVLAGHAEILGYFKNWRQTFDFEKGELRSLSTLSSSASERLASSDAATIEARLTGTVTQGGKSKPYVQDYVCFAYLDEAGKVVRYQEYWDPARFTS